MVYRATQLNKNNFIKKSEFSFLIAMLALLLGCAHDQTVEKSKDTPEARTLRHGIRSAIRENMDGYYSCYNELLERKPNAEGKILLGWDVVDKGAAANTTVVESTIKDTKMEKCMQKVTEKVAFPAPPNGREMRVGYPFVFTSKADSKNISQ